MGKKVLVADDEAHIRHVLSMKLSNAGYDVVTATDGEEALEVCLTETPDLVCTDYQMPYMSGLDLCRQLHENERTRNIPILMLTARGFDIEPEEMAAARISAVLAKPFSPREVLARVNELLAPAGAASSTEQV